MPAITIPKNKTKIICTIGPASRDQQSITRLIANGMTIARLNFSHGSYQEHAENIKTIRAEAKQLGVTIPILIDLPGTKIRIGQLQEEPITLQNGQKLILTSDDSILGTTEILPLEYKQLPTIVQPPQIIYLNDGFIQLKVEETTKTEIHTTVIVGGELYSRKGINLPASHIDIDAITPKDLEIIEFGLKQGIETFCISFIQTAEDIKQVRKHAQRIGQSIHVIAKIERAQALANYDEILEHADGIMVARGDLGVEIPIEQVPVIQKRLIQQANIAGKPIIVATQMLESMTKNIRPTRAEVTDVANAIYDGTDAIMLSEETAVGEYPIQTVKMMARIAQTTEEKMDISRHHVITELLRKKRNCTLKTEDVISLNAIDSATILKARYVLTPTDSGHTAQRISRFKPRAWILAFSRYETTCNFLYFSYGVYPIIMANEQISWHPKIIPFLKKHQLVKDGDVILLTQGRFTSKGGGTDSLGILTIGNDNAIDDDTAVGF